MCQSDSSRKNACKGVSTLNARPFFSIIVPVHKVSQELLIQCLKSVCDQTFESFEALLLVDDETPIPLLDERFVVLHLSPCSVGEARNRGIRAAKGERLIFVDCDDRISKDYLHHSYALCIRYPSAIVVFGSRGDENEGSFSPENGHFFDATTFKNVCTDWLCGIRNPFRPFLLTVWGKVFPSSIKGGPFFGEARMLGEDCAYMVKLSCRGYPLFVVNNYFPYFYKKNESSSTSNLTYASIGYSEAWKERESIFCYHLDSNQRKKFSSNTLNTFYMDVLGLYAGKFTASTASRKEKVLFLSHLTRTAKPFIKELSSQKHTTSIRRRSFIAILCAFPLVASFILDAKLKKI